MGLEIVFHDRDSSGMFLLGIMAAPFAALFGWMMGHGRPAYAFIVFITVTILGFAGSIILEFRHGGRFGPAGGTQRLPLRPLLLCMMIVWLLYLLLGKDSPIPWIIWMVGTIPAVGLGPWLP